MHSPLPNKQPRSQIKYMLEIIGKEALYPLPHEPLPEPLSLIRILVTRMVALLYEPLHCEMNFCRPERSCPFFSSNQHCIVHQLMEQFKRCETLAGRLCSRRRRHLRLQLLQAATASRGKFHSVIPPKAPRSTFGETNVCRNIFQRAS